MGASHAMSWILVIWSMLAAACLTLAAIHLPVWLANRAARPSLFFSLLCIGTAGLVVGEAALMHARTPQEFAGYVRWLHVAIWLVLVSLVAFVHFYLDAGRAWLAWTVIGLRSLSLLANFTTGVNANFVEVVSLQYADFFGQQVPLPVGEPNPWMFLGQAAAWLCVLYIGDATYTAWRRGLRAKALLIGASSVFLLVASAMQAVLLVWAGLQGPLTNGPMFLPLIAVMAFQLSRDLLRAQQLAVELGESEQRMVLAAGAANLGIWTRDLAREETWANSQWRDLFGFAPAEAVTADRVIAKVHPEDRDRVRLLLTEAAQPGVHHTEFRVLLPDGRVRWVASQGQAEFDGAGHPIRTRGASIDCTKRKQTEQELLLLREEVAHAGRVAVMGHLASGLAHEINQPLGAILRNAEAAALFLQQESPDLDELRAIIEDIRMDDQRAGAVIDRMRSLLRRQAVELRPLAVQELFADIAALLRPEAAARRVSLDLDLPGDVLRVAGDRVHLQQVLLNLVSNGMDAIDEAARGGRSIVLSARRAGAEAVEIAVSDSGRGIAANDMGQIFDPFYTTKAKGLGMGLAISRTIVEAHGGTLRAENHASGARFLFTVPTAGDSSR